MARKIASSLHHGTGLSILPSSSENKFGQGVHLLLPKTIKVNGYNSTVINLMPCTFPMGVSS